MTKRYAEEFEKVICERYLEGESATAIAKSLNKGTTAITRCLKRYGIEIRKCAGEHHPSWKGGRVSKGDGYIGIWKPDHERADKQGYVFEHTLVVEETIGRLPQKGEVVHHINNDKRDNSPDNLFVCDHREHLRIHRQFEKLTKPLLEKGVIRFDRRKAEYVLTERKAIIIGTVKRDTTKIERQFDGHYALSTVAGVKLLLADYHAFQARQFLGDYDAVVVLADLAEAIRLAELTERQQQALALVYYEDLTQVEAGKRLGGLAKNTVSELLDRACEAIADVYYYWASHGEGYSVTSEIRSEGTDDNDE